MKKFGKAGRKMQRGCGGDGPAVVMRRDGHIIGLSHRCDLTDAANACRVEIGAQDVHETFAQQILKHAGSCTPRPNPSGVTLSPAIFLIVRRFVTGQGSSNQSR